MSASTQHWEALVSTALLGTDRRDPPAPPAGPLADLAADLPQPTPSRRLLQQVAALTASRRAGVLPALPVAPLPGAPADPRPVIPAAAVRSWRHIVNEWPVLEDEWLLAVVQCGRRIAPEMVVDLLARHRTDAVRHARALLATGPLGQWMIGFSPRLGATGRAHPPVEAVTSLPELAIVPELAALLDASPAAVVAAVAGGIGSGAFGPAHRAVLTNVVARVAPATLPALAAALDRVDPASTSIGLAFALSDLARVRHAALTELTPPQEPT